MIAVLAVGAIAAVILSRAESVVTPSSGLPAAAPVAAELREPARGAYVVRTRNPGRPPRGATLPFWRPLPSSFVLLPDGGYADLARSASLDRRSVAYDAASGVETTVFVSDGRPQYLRATGLDPAQLATHAPYAALGAWVLGAVAADDPGVREIAVGGRPAWSLSARFAPGTNLNGQYGARLDVAVDKETGLVLRVVQYALDPTRWTAIASVRDLRIGAPAEPAELTVPKPPGAVTHEHDYGFERVPVADAAAIVGYRPLLPADALGRELADFAVAKRTGFPFPGLPARADVVSALYGRGAAAITVSTQPGAADELFALRGGQDEPLTLTDGPLAGRTSYLSAEPAQGAVLVGVADGLLVRVTAPSPREAVAIAESLRPGG